MAAVLMVEALQSENEDLFVKHFDNIKKIEEYERINILCTRIGENGQTVLHVALESNRVHETRLILGCIQRDKLRILFEQRDSRGMLPMQSRALNWTLFESLWMEIPTEIRASIIAIRDNCEETILHSEVRQKNNACIRVILHDLQSDNRWKVLGLKNDTGRTALHMAAEQDEAVLLNSMLHQFDPTDIQAMEVLLERCTDDATFLHVAARNPNRAVIVKFILQALGNDLSCKLLTTHADNNRNLMWYLIEKRDTELLELIKRELPNHWLSLIKSQAESRQTAIHHAVATENPEVIRCLLTGVSEDESLALLTNRDNDGNIPLYLAPRVFKEIVAAVMKTPISGDLGDEMIMLFNTRISEKLKEYVIYGRPKVLLLYSTHQRDEALPEMYSIRDALTEAGLVVLPKEVHSRAELLDHIDQTLANTVPAFIVVIMCHGSRGCLTLVENPPATLHEIIRHMSPMGRHPFPKVLIVQACQEDDQGFMITDRGYELLDEDSMLLMAALSGRRARRNAYIPALASNIREHRLNQPLDKIHCKAIHSMNRSDSAQQIPYMKKTMNKEFYLKFIDERL